MTFFGYSILSTRELMNLIEGKSNAEAATMLLADAIVHQDDLTDLHRKMHLHSTHLDVVEARIDKQNEQFSNKLNALAARIANLKPKALETGAKTSPSRRAKKRK